MRITYTGLTCAVASQVATLTTTAGLTEAHPTQLALAAGGVVVNLTANVAEMFKTTDKYTVIIQRET